MVIAAAEDVRGRAGPADEEKVDTCTICKVELAQPNVDTGVLDCVSFLLRVRACFSWKDGDLLVGLKVSSSLKAKDTL